MPWWIFAVGGAAIAAVSSLITAKIVKKRCKRQLEDILEETSEELSKMKIERDRMYRSFVQTGDPATSKERAQLWKQIEDEVRKGRKQIANEKPEPIDLDDSTVSNIPDIGARRSIEDRVNYQKILTHQDYASHELPKPTEGIVRKEAPNGIVEIEPWEARGDNARFPIVDLYFNEATCDLTTDDESLVNPDEIPSWVGYSQEQLALRFLHDDEPSDIYVINPNHECIYNIYIRSGEWGK